MSKQLVERVDRFLSALPPEIANEAAYLFEQMQNQRRYWKKKYLVRSVDWGNTKKQRDELLAALESLITVTRHLNPCEGTLNMCLKTIANVKGENK